MIANAQKDELKSAERRTGHMDGQLILAFLSAKRYGLVIPYQACCAVLAKSWSRSGALHIPPNDVMHHMV